MVVRIAQVEQRVYIKQPVNFPADMMNERLKLSIAPSRMLALIAAYSLVYTSVAPGQGFQRCTPGQGIALQCTDMY